MWSLFVEYWNKPISTPSQGFDSQPVRAYVKESQRSNRIGCFGLAEARCRGRDEIQGECIEAQRHELARMKEEEQRL